MSLKTLGGSILLGPGGSPTNCDNNPCCSTGPAGPCLYQWDCTALVANPIGETFPPHLLQVGLGCPSSIQVNVPWIHIIGPTSHLSAGTYQWSVDPNPFCAPARSGRVNVVKGIMNPNAAALCASFNPLFNGILVTQGVSLALEPVMRAINERMGRANLSLGVPWPTRIFNPDLTVCTPAEQVVPTRPATDFHAGVVGTIDWPPDDFYKGDIALRPPTGGNDSYISQLINTIRADMDIDSGLFAGIFFKNTIGTTVFFQTNASVYPGGVLPALATLATYCARYNDFKNALSVKLQSIILSTGLSNQQVTDTFSTTGLNTGSFADTKACAVAQYPQPDGTSDTFDSSTASCGSPPCCVDAGVPGPAIGSFVGINARTEQPFPNRFHFQIQRQRWNWPILSTNYLGINHYDLHGYFADISGGDIASYIAPTPFGSPPFQTYVVIQSNWLIATYVVTNSVMDTDALLCANALPIPLLGNSFDRGWSLQLIKAETFFDWDETLP